LALFCTVSLLAVAQDAPPPPNRVILHDQVAWLKHATAATTAHSPDSLRIHDAKRGEYSCRES
jgi:hypothetical protein